MGKIFMPITGRQVKIPHVVEIKTPWLMVIATKL
jgi:hypothetical protein